MHVSAQLPIRQSQDDAGGGAGLGPDLNRGLQVNDTRQTTRFGKDGTLNGSETEKMPD